MSETVTLSCQLLDTSGNPIKSPIAHSFTVTRYADGRIELNPVGEIVFSPAIGRNGIRLLQITGMVDGKEINRLIELNQPTVVNPEHLMWKIETREEYN